MARTRKPKVNKTPEDATGPEVPEPEEVEAGAENRPSQLDQMRAALSDAPAREEPAEELPELPQPEAPTQPSSQGGEGREEPELPAHVDDPAAAAAEPEAEEAEPVTDSAPPPAEETSSS